MEKTKLIFFRDFLFRYFITGLFFAILMFSITKFFWFKWSYFICSSFQLTQSELGSLVVNSFLQFRFFLVFLLLVPAIALHWTIKRKH